MEHKFGGKASHLRGPTVSDLKKLGKRTMEWDLNGWKWDGDLFRATQLNSVPSDCGSKQFFPPASEPVTVGLSISSSSSDEIIVDDGKGKRELEKKRRVVVIEDEACDELGSLNLKLGAQVYPIMEGEVKSGKKTKLIGATPNRAVCQVEDCRADLGNAKDYHRRHKVCDMHSKASKALVGNVMQRFCQQCSRFHLLQEFDEGKRSCRRRLAGHNRRRRKTHPDTVVNGGSLNDERGIRYLLMSVLRILSNMHANSSDQTKDQDLLSHILKNLASSGGTINERDIPGLLQGSQDLLNAGTSVGTAEKVPDMVSNGLVPNKLLGSASRMADGCDLQASCRPIGPCLMATVPEMAEKRVFTDDAQVGMLQNLSGTQPTNRFPTGDGVPAMENMQGTTHGRIKLNNFDLNNVYNDSQDCIENPERSYGPANPGTRPLDRALLVQQDSYKSSPPQTSANSDSTSAQSLSTSSGEAQSRTDRIVFKLFGKDPSDFPLVMRKQVLDWLSHTPTEIESFIRPGCIILTIYLRLGKSTWEELCCDLGSSLSRLLDMSEDSFWRTGWVYTRVQNRLAFIYSGQVVLDTPLPFKSHNCRISSIKPIAVPVSEQAQFVVKGFNLAGSATRLLCALEGRYLVQETCYELTEGTDTFIEHDDLQCLSFPCSVPNISGRGFIEVEDHGLNSSFFPFIVAEQDVCSEICMLEGVIDMVETAEDILRETGKMQAKYQALDFIHEMGWLLHRNYLKFRLGDMDPNLDLFPFKRFKCLMEFSVDHDWCAVVKKLLGIVFSGTVNAGEHPSIEIALLDMCLLHSAVRRNCRPMVELLLRFIPDKILDKSGSNDKRWPNSGSYYLFKPDFVGPAGLTPLHIAASMDGSENVLDALTDDPELVGIEAWKSARDKVGSTPNDYACLRGHNSYIQLVQKKINNKLNRRVVLDIPDAPLDCNTKPKPSDGLKSVRFPSLQIEKQAARQHCKLCEQKLAYGDTRMRTSLAYRPAMLSMVAIAAVCVCVALLFKSSPEVLYAFRPFRWELLKYGSS